MDTLSEAFEQRHLEETLAWVREKDARVSADKAAVDAQIAEMMENYDSENLELRMALLVVEDARRALEAQLRALGRAKDSPYFGRIDFRADDEDVTNRLYIGRNGFFDEAAQTVVVVDWRTPVANLYYESAVGHASYVSAEDTITGELSCKRTYNIKRGHLNAYYDADMVANDELLQEYLTRSASAVLRDIVATIQKDQNEIIRIPPWRDVLVQGVAGSGKTTVALHRLAYLLFNYADQLKNAGVLVIGSNRMFLSYIAGMLPDLGVENVRQMVMGEFLRHMLRLPQPEREAETLPEQTAWQSGQAFFDALAAYVRAFEDGVFLAEDLMLDGEPVMPRTEIDTLVLGDRRHDMADRAEQMQRILELRLSTALPQRIAQLEAQSDRDVAAFRAGEDTGYTRVGDIIDRRNAHVAQAKKEAAAMRLRFARQVRKMTPEKLYCAFLTQCARDGAREAQRIARRVKSGQYGLYDLAALLYVTARLEGLEQADEFRHLVIDEAQDFGASLYAVLAAVFPQPRTTFTILGDVSQNLAGDAGVSDWDTVLERSFAGRRHEFRVLSKSYRNTIEIAETANAVLSHSHTRAYDITPVVRHGEPVAFDRLPASALPAAIETEIAAWRQRPAGEEGSLAVICPTAQAARRLHAVLHDRDGVSLFAGGAGETAAYAGGVSVFDIGSVKGLEFDRVILADAGAAAYPETQSAVRALYVACTRALHSLRVLYSGERSPLFTAATE